jgi:hypothetical protein
VCIYVFMYVEHYREFRDDFVKLRGPSVRFVVEVETVKLRGYVCRRVEMHRRFRMLHDLLKRR